MSENWTDLENSIIVNDYFNMLTEELTNLKYNKTNHRNTIIPLLNERKKGSVEYKHQNISAVLAEMGLPFIDGYKPAYKFQLTLTQAVDKYLRKNPELETLFKQFSDIVPASKEVEFSKWSII